jgi:hypothetical protein
MRAGRRKTPSRRLFEFQVSAELLSELLCEFIRRPDQCGQAFHWFNPGLARNRSRSGISKPAWVGGFDHGNDRKLQSIPFLEDYEALLLNTELITKRSAR